MFAFRNLSAFLIILLLFHTSCCVVSKTHLHGSKRYNEKRQLQDVYLYHIPMSCPNSGTIEVPSGVVIRLPFSPSGKLCTLTRRNTDGFDIIPIIRSYDENPWENVAGPYKTLALNCNNYECDVIIPDSQDPNQTYILESFEHNVSLKDEAARFFEQATFGVTTSDLDKVQNEVDSKESLLSYFTQWTYDQIYNEPVTSHRGYWRRRTFPFYEQAGREGRATLPCEVGSFWRAYAFIETDKDRELSVDFNNGKYTLSVDGNLRTVIKKFEFADAATISFPMTFNICYVAPKIGGSLLIDFEGKCRLLKGGNPTVDYGEMQPRPPTVSGINVLESIMDGDQITMMTLKSYSFNEACNVRQKSVFLKIYNGKSMQTLIYEPRFAFRANYQLGPLSDGGGNALLMEGGESAQCSNVPRTFLNERGCQLTLDPNACEPTVFIDGYVKLSPENIKLFFTKHKRFVYSVRNLRLEDDKKVESPCKHGVRSRWRNFGTSNECDQNLQSSTASIFRTLLLNSEDTNPHIKDLYLPTSENCHVDDSVKVEFSLNLNGDCWKTVHPDFLNVYDFTGWTLKHPGNSSNQMAIKQFALNGEHSLAYPDSHGMPRWNNYKKDFPYLGRLGDNVDFNDFPNALRVVAIASTFGLVTPGTGEGVKSIVCGSPFEAESHLFPTPFSIARRPELEFLKPKEFDQQKKSVWGMIVTEATDQLRQRVAWALSQLLVVSPSAIQFSFQSESFLNYYDIFVKNGLGNYFDVLREVAYSPMMAEMLSYLNSKSSEYVWTKDRQIQYADENFAREIMQLFTIGLVKLNIDGTTELDLNGQPIPTYSNDDITEYARVWTGFRRQQQRGNVEERGINFNSIDPMAIHIKWRDQYPKLGLEKTYIGDYYPLCYEFQPKSFLKEKAKYRLLGKSTQSDIQSIDPKSVLALDDQSALRNKLCNPYKYGACSYPGIVYLDETLDCSGVECNLAVPPKIVYVGDNVHYEYVQPPCVQFPFSDNNIVLIINPDGKVAIEREDTSLNNEYFSLTYFRVLWADDSYPHFERNSCGDGVCEIVATSCRCQILLEDKQVFYSVPTREDILSKLHIGALPPNMYSYPSKAQYQNFAIHSVYDFQNLGFHSAFEVKDDFGRTLFLKNALLNVVIRNKNDGTSSQYSFRNPPSFYGNVPEVRDAQYETEAALAHYFYHQNTAPFIAVRLIQRFGISNPSPRYIKVVAEAFRSGQYQVSHNSKIFGNGEYGDLAATVAAILLDRESRSTILQMDLSFGGLREPILKLTSTLRSMEYVQTSNDFFSLHNLYASIGQEPHNLPSVFSFFLPGYEPPGVLSKASLVAPEAMISPNTIGFLNGMISLVKYGLNPCDGGFGGQRKCRRQASDGYLSYSNGQNDNTEKIIDDLATLLTSGRLSDSHRRLFKEVYSNEKNSNEALKLLQQMAILSPEYSSTGVIQESLRKRPSINRPTKSCKRYKAVVHILLQGGCDSFNLLVPHSQCEGKDMYNEYKAVRGAVSLPKEDLLTVDATSSNQVCNMFGLHPKLPFLKELYDDEDALFFAGVGVLSEPVSKNDYSIKTKTQLFAHNTIQAEISRLDPFNVEGKTGILGRLVDSLSRKYSVNAFSIDSTLVALEGLDVNVPKTAVNSELGFHRFNPSSVPGDVINSNFDLLNAAQKPGSNLFSSTWSSSLHESVIISNRLYNAENSVNLNTTFPSTKFGNQMEIVSKIIASHECRGSDRDVFYIETGSFDGHSQVLPGLEREFDFLNEGLSSFVNEMKNLPGNMWDDVVLVISSDFGRTLSANSGGGTDHGWSGVSMMLGGSLDGGRILGEYPDDLTSDSPLDIGRGRLIPTMPFDSIWNGVTEWLGVADSKEKDKILPNLVSFPTDVLYTNKELFVENSVANATQCENEGEYVWCSENEIPAYDDDYYYYEYATNEESSHKSVAAAIVVILLLFAAVASNYIRLYLRTRERPFYNWRKCCYFKSDINKSFETTDSFDTVALRDVMDVGVEVKASNHNNYLL